MGESKRRNPFLTTRLSEETRCLNCNMLMDAATSVSKARKPTPGSCGICLYCGHIMAYDNNLKLRQLTDDEMITIAANEDVIRIQKARGEMIKEATAEGKWPPKMR